MNRLQEELLQFLQQPGYKPLKPKLLGKKLGVTKKKWASFEQALAAAEAAGDVIVLSSGRLQARRQIDTYSGTVRKISSGAAYILLQDPRPAGVEGDVFVEQEDLQDAQNGDIVLIRLRRRRRANGQRCGIVLEVLERATNVFVGTYLEEDDAGWVRIDGKNFVDPVAVGDPGAKGARPGDKVVVELLRFPSVGQPGEGVLTRVLGARGEPGVDTQMVIHEFGIPDEFPESVLAAARLQAEVFNDLDLSDREDLSQSLVITIDPRDARDFDDAISLDRTEDGHWHLGVHIADVSHFVQPGTELDREAQSRGNSVYLPTKVIPMLPEIISNGLASLQEDRVRYTVSAFMEFSPEGIPVNSRFARTAIRVKQRFAYEEILPIVHGTDRRAVEKTPPEIRQLLGHMHTLAMLLRGRRFERGALELEMPEVKLDLDADGKVIGAHETEHDASHQMIEEFMLAANISVAVKLNDLGLGFIRRVHQDPHPQKMAALGTFVANLGYPLKKVQSRYDLQRLLKKVKGAPEEYAVHYAILRSLKQAVYSPVADGHYALAEHHYCHFTSPIRRYPDLVVHRQLMGILTHQKNSTGAGLEELLRLGKHCSTTERRAERAERELIKIKLLEYMSTRIGDEMEAIITGVDHFGFFCRGVEIPAEGLVHISSLVQGTRFEFDRDQMALVSRTGQQYRLGDRVRVEIAHVDVDRRELNFKIAAGKRKSRSGPAGRKKKK